MKYLKSLTLLGLTALFFNPTPAFAQPDFDEMEEMSERKARKEMRGMFKNLDLSDEQKEQLKAMRQANKGQGKDLREKVKAARQALEEAQKSEASKSEILKRFDELAKLRTEMGRMRLERMLDMREILTPEQRVKAREHMKERRQERQSKRRGRRD